MRVFMIASEIAPLAKSGGLADAVAGLSQALASLGVEITLVMPAYGEVLGGGVPCKPAGIEIEVPMGARARHGAVWEASLGQQLPVYLIRADDYYLREGLYGTAMGDYPDNAERFIFFSKAALQLAVETGPWDILHCNDWQSALVGVFQKLSSGRKLDCQVVLSIHNLAYQGAFPDGAWELLNLDRRYFDPKYLEYYGQVNFLKGGILLADALTTVSGKYAEEILTAEFGCGLEGVLQSREKVLLGILNGADYTQWNPEWDPFIVENYGITSMDGKQSCKRDLQELFGLAPDPKTPLVGMVSRLDTQKGIDIVLDVLDRILDLHIQLVVLGKGAAAYEEALSGYGERAKNMGVKIGFDNTLAHKIEAGADIFLMPSRYEPCGLNQIYSLKYGTIPIVRATGGLDDTIEDYDSGSVRGNGFKFSQYAGSALLGSLQRALGVYGEKASWEQLVGRAMACNFSWSRSAGEYLNLYRKLVGRN